MSDHPDNFSSNYNPNYGVIYADGSDYDWVPPVDASILTIENRGQLYALNIKLTDDTLLYNSSIYIDVDSQQISLAALSYSMPGYYSFKSRSIFDVTFFDRLDRTIIIELTKPITFEYLIDVRIYNDSSTRVNGYYEYVYYLLD